MYFHILKESKNHSTFSRLLDSRMISSHSKAKVKMTRCSIFIQCYLIFLNISVLLSANGTSSSSGASSLAKSEVDGRSLAEKIQSEISEKLNSTFAEKRIYYLHANVKRLHSEFQQLNPGSEKKKSGQEKKKHKIVLEYNKIMDTIDQICTTMKIWTEDFSRENELGYLFHIGKLENSLKEELTQLDKLINGIELMIKGAAVPDMLTSSMRKLRDDSLQLVQLLFVELWFLLPAAEFTKLGENVEQDKMALGTAIRSLVDTSGRRAEIFATGIPSIIQNAKDQLQTEYNRGGTSQFVKFIKDDDTNLVRQLEEQMSNDSPLCKVDLRELIRPDMKRLYDKKEYDKKCAREQLGKFARKFNRIVDDIPAKISQKLVEKEDEDEHASLRLLDLLKAGTQKLYVQMKSLMKCQLGTPELEKNVGILRILAEWTEEKLHDLAVTDAFPFESIQEEIQEKGIDLSKPEVFSAAVTGRDLKQRVILGAIFCMAIFKRLDTLFQKAFPNGNSANKKDAENVLKAMEAGGSPSLIGTKLYRRYINFMNKGDQYKFKVLVKLENLQKEFKQKLDKIQEVAKSEAKRMDPRLSECFEFLSKIGNLDQQLWKWALGQIIQENEANEVPRNKVELENLYFIGAELAKLKMDPAKMLMMKNEADLFGESESPLSNAIYTLHERTNQLVDQLSMEIWLLLPADEFAQLGVGIEQDKADIRASIDTLVSTADRNAQISAKVIPELIEREKSKIAELLNEARARIGHGGQWEERQSFFKMLNDHSKSLSKVDLKLVSSSQLYSAGLFNDNMDRIHSELSRKVKKEDRNEYQTFRDYEQLSVVNRKFYEYMAAAINSPPGSPELEDNLEKLWILARRVKVSLEKRSRYTTPPLQLLELIGKKDSNLVNFVSVQRTMPRSLLLTAIAGRENLLDRIVLRAMHLLFMFTHRFSRIFAGLSKNQVLWFFEGCKSNQEVKGMVDAELVPVQIGQKLLYQYQQAELQNQQKAMGSQFGKVEEPAAGKDGDVTWQL